MKKYFRFLFSALSFILPVTGKAGINALSYTDYYNQGIKFHEAGQYDSALEAYNKAMELELNNADLYFKKGLTLNELK